MTYSHTPSSSRSQSSSSPSESATTLLRQAKAGDPKAIATLFNQSLQPKGITARAILQDRTLKITLASQDLPQEMILLPHLKKALSNLAPHSIESVSVYGFQTGFSRPIWSYNFALAQTEPVDRVQRTSSLQPSSQVPIRPNQLDHRAASTDPLRSMLIDLESATLRTLAQHLQISDPSPSISLVMERVRYWQQQAQRISDGNLDTMPERDLQQMLLSLKMVQLTGTGTEDLRMMLGKL